MRKSWLRNKNVIITGASSGIGRELVKTLIKEFGCRVLGVSRDEGKAQNFANELSSVSYIYRCFDVGVEENWISFRKYLDEIDFKADILINNAGVLPAFCRIENMDLNLFQEVMQINYWSVIYSVRYLSDKILLSKTPAIINVSSSSALALLVGTAPYTASKSALRNFSDCYSAEMKGKLYVSTICPGFTQTDIFRSQKRDINSGLIRKISTPVSKMSKKILKKINKRKRRAVLGLDAHLMSVCARLMPHKSTSIFAFVLKKSKLEIFKDIFD